MAVTFKLGHNVEGGKRQGIPERSECVEREMRGVQCSAVHEQPCMAES